MPYLDARIPVRFRLPTAAADAVPDGAVVLVEEGLPVHWPAARVSGFPATAPAEPGPHPAGCACCVARLQAGEALRRLFLSRVRGETAFFTEVTVVARPATLEALRAALRDDPGLSGWFRAADPD